MEGWREGGRERGREGELERERERELARNRALEHFRRSEKKIPALQGSLSREGSGGPFFSRLRFPIIIKYFLFLKNQFFLPQNLRF